MNNAAGNVMVLRAIPDSPTPQHSRILCNFFRMFHTSQCCVDGILLYVVCLSAALRLKIDQHFAATREPAEAMRPVA